MALYTHAVNLSAAGTKSVPANVSASDTIAQADIGTRGAVLRVINGSGGSINVTVADPGPTDLGNTGNAAAVPVPAGDFRMIYVAPFAVNLGTQVATVTYSGTTTVTCELYRL